MKTGVLLINLGTPDSPSTGDVRKYLREFLMDRRVIDINPVGRWFLINMIIAPFRAPKSAALYQKIWMKEGSPLLIHGLNLKKKLQESLGNDFHVAFGMRYQSPSIQSALDELRKEKVSRIIVFPLYPQYASSSTGSTIEKVMEQVGEWEVTPEMKFISKFHDSIPYLEAVIDSAKAYDHNAYDHVLFSFHGLPERHILKGDAHYGSGECKLGNCCEVATKGNQYCYRANCFQTAIEVAKRLNIPKEKYTIAFQSRLGKDPWIKPYSDHEIIQFAKDGKKKILAFSLSFVADCLETTHEMGTEYHELFREHGGEKIQLVPSLNSNARWVEAVKEMINS
ncbi:MAG TPA: ferrochelatase [Bacteroidia bacterium]|jgi:ferrochelatase|nr:ferrochelatase [Bacteroidia bacterium]